MTVRIYVEGGFEGSTKSNCRRAFRTFLEKVIQPGSFQVTACGYRISAFEGFRLALRQRLADYNLLLVDSETAVNANPWEHLSDRESDNWNRPAGASEDQAHLMVQVMESWFLADKNALADFYGQGFLRKALPQQPNIEEIARQDVLKKLRHASKPTQKGEYHKTRHGFELLELIEPGLVRAASHHADSLFLVLEKQTSV